jgi:hypothetical protein
MSYKQSSYSKKPDTNEIGKQLFSFDVAKNIGAKNFFFSSYKNIYDLIKKEPKNSHFYEDNTFSKGIKLFIDYDNNNNNQPFPDTFSRDKFIEYELPNILDNINSKLFSFFNITNTPAIVLISDTLNKASIHIIYPHVVFNNIYHMGFFMHDGIANIHVDHSVYKTGCFRMMFCSKKGKYNNLVYYNSFNYSKPSDYNLFLDACICHIDPNIVPVNIDPFIKQTFDSSFSLSKKNKKTLNINRNNNNNNIQKNYRYINIDLNIVKQSLDKLTSFANDYMKWLYVTASLQDLYLSSSPSEQTHIYDLFVGFSNSSSKYSNNNSRNRSIFLNVKLNFTINHLFKFANIDYFVLPFYSYTTLLFNPLNHVNLITDNVIYIDPLNINFDLILQHKYIFIKSPTGTGKTTILKSIIQHIKYSHNISNIISITSRKNLAYKHSIDLKLKYYNSDNIDFNKCRKLSIQLESLTKCKYILYKNGVVVLDEIHSLLSHFRSKTLDNKRSNIYLCLLELVRHSKYVVSLDADLADWNISFLQEIQQNNYIVYHNISKNKIGTKAIFYNNPQSLVNLMAEHIVKKHYFIACFDCVKHLNKVVSYLSKLTTTDTNNWLIYSSETDYNLIDTKLWINKFVFFSPSIIYGIDFNFKSVNVFAFVLKRHLNPLQIYQMISRARSQSLVHVYCNNKESYVKYKSVDHVASEINRMHNTISHILPSYINELYISDKPYTIMFYNYIYIDSLLKTNIKEYLIDIMINCGYEIEYNNIDEVCKVSKIDVNRIVINEFIINLLKLDKNNLNDFETLLVTNNSFLEKHFNLRILLSNSVEEKFLNSIVHNLFVETLNNKKFKLVICKKLMEILKLTNLRKFTKNVSLKFTKILKNKWLIDTNNFNSILKKFNIRTDKYNSFSYYNMYLLLITIMKNLFDCNLFEKLNIQINNVRYTYYLINTDVLKQHTVIIDKIKNKDLVKYFK